MPLTDSSVRMAGELSLGADCLATTCSSAGIFSTGRIWVAQPASMALFGMPSYLAVEGSCTMQMPPTPRMARSP